MSVPEVEGVIERLALAIAADLPEATRGKAVELLRDQILPPPLASKGPAELRPTAEAMYVSIRQRLASSDTPLLELRRIARQQELAAWQRQALLAAVARYVADHPDALAAAAAFADVDPSGLAGRAAAEVATSASAGVTEFDAWEKDAITTVPEELGVAPYLVRMTFQAARTGVFSPMAGPLVDFLHTVHEPVEELHFF